jgi:hypothetical protein
MAKLRSEITEVINRLKQESLEIVDKSTALELKIFERFGESEPTMSYMDEMKNVSEQAISSFSQLSSLQLQASYTQPDLPVDTAVSRFMRDNNSSEQTSCEDAWDPSNSLLF